MAGRAGKTAALFVLVALLGAARLSAEPRLPALFGDHMVLQRGRAIPVWGRADPGEAVIVTLDLSSRETKAGADGRWRVDLPAHDAGGPFTLTVRGRTSRVFRDVLVGEVWVASGQSNMTFELARASRLDAAAAWHERLRLFTVAKTTTIQPEGDVTGAWQRCTPETAVTFSAVAYYFGRRLEQELDVPVGVIHTSWPGSAAEEWTAPVLLERDTQFAPITDGWKKRQAAWTGGEHNPLALDLQFTGLDFVDTKGEAKTPPLPLGPGGASRPWRFAWDAAPEMTYDWLGGATPSARLGGELRARDSARLTIDLLPDQSPANLVAFDAVRVRVRGTGTFRIRALQPSITDGDDYGSDPIVVSGEPRDVLVPFGSFKQAGWGVQKPFSPAAVTALQVEPLLGANGARPPTGLYNAMILPLVPYGIQGAIRYQGEGNASRGPQYRTLLPAMIGSWRSAWGQGDFPFLIVQLPGYRNPSPSPQDSGWAELREAQVMALRTPNTGLAITIDVGEALDIHPANKRPVGERLARVALGMTYRRPGEYSGPMYESMRVDDAVARIRFTHTGAGLAATDHRPLRGFAIAGADRKFVWARAEIDGDTVTVSHPDVPQPVAVRYAWADNPECNLGNQDGLPASPFRTDEWERPTPAPPTR